MLLALVSGLLGVAPEATLGEISIEWEYHRC